MKRFKMNKKLRSNKNKTQRRFFVLTGDQNEFILDFKTKQATIREGDKYLVKSAERHQQPSNKYITEK